MRSWLNEWIDSLGTSWLRLVSIVTGSAFGLAVLCHLWGQVPGTKFGCCLVVDTRSKVQVFSRVGCSSVSPRNTTITTIPSVWHKQMKQLHLKNYHFVWSTFWISSDSFRDYLSTITVHYCWKMNETYLSARKWESIPGADIGLFPPGFVKELFIFLLGLGDKQLSGVSCVTFGCLAPNTEKTKRLFLMAFIPLLP